MQREDKIIQLIQDLSGKVNNIQEGQERLTGRMDTLQEGQERLTERVDDISLHLENVTDKKIQILLEQHIPNVERLDRNTEKIEKIEFDVDNIKRVVISHSDEINKLSGKK